MYQIAKISKSYSFNLYEEFYKHFKEETIGDKIKKLRLSRYLSQREFTNLVGITEDALNNYESHLVLPPATIIKSIAATLNVPIQYFIMDEYYQFVLFDYEVKIKKWREKNCLSIREASKLTGISASAINSWENSKYTISRKNFDKIKIYLE
jgi:transcriptional regulator with XRE-family HTH domain